MDTKGTVLLAYYGTGNRAYVDALPDAENPEQYAQFQRWWERTPLGTVHGIMKGKLTLRIPFVELPGWDAGSGQGE